MDGNDFQNFLVQDYNYSDLQRALNESSLLFLNENLGAVILSISRSSFHRVPS